MRNVFFFSMTSTIRKPVSGLDLSIRVDLNGNYFVLSGPIAKFAVFSRTQEHTVSSGQMARLRKLRQDSNRTAESLDPIRHPGLVIERTPSHTVESQRCCVLTLNLYRVAEVL